MKVPFNDLKRIHDPLKSEFDAAWERVYENNGFVLGKEVDDFEDMFAQYCGFNGKEYAAGVSNGTDAIELILRAWEVKEGDEVITVAHTFNMSISAIRLTGAKPVFVDVDKDTHLMDMDQIRAKINPKTKAIMPVHLYGQMVDMDSLKSIAEEYNLKILEDACQSHGAMQNGVRAGVLGDAAAFSFYPGKNLGAFGDGGIVVSKDIETIEKIKKLRNYGQTKKYHHDEMGFNKRLHGLQAAILKVKLPHLDSWNADRERIANKITQQLKGVGDLKIVEVKAGNTHIYHLYIIETENRDKLAEFLDSKGIQTGIHYPIPVHLQKAFNYLGEEKGSYPISEEIANHTLTLPVFPKMTDEEIDYLCSCVKEYFSQEKERVLWTP